MIMDGNGRWAQSRGLERVDGHVRGVESVRCAIKTSLKYGVGVLTIYAFSTENWGRPAAEVEALMELFGKCIVKEIPELVEQGVKVSFIGDRAKFSEQMQSDIAQAEQMSIAGERLTLQIALNYSSRDEIVRAVKSIAKQVESGAVACDQITQELISNTLDTRSVADPDLIIRTSGEMRLSNFLLWQAAYSELYITDVLWPDFDEAEYVKAIEVYTQRDRRFGVLK